MNREEKQEWLNEPDQALHEDDRDYNFDAGSEQCQVSRVLLLL
jgi:hypothetical protein